jgi:hypothetical protein
LKYVVTEGHSATGSNAEKTEVHRSAPPPKKVRPFRRRMNLSPGHGLGMHAMPRNGLLVMAFRKQRTEAPMAVISILLEFLRTTSIEIDGVAEAESKCYTGHF